MKNSIGVNYSGFTLIEVLVAVIVLSIGLLGLAGLQVVGMRNNSNSYITSQATFLAYDIADRMRANPGEADSYKMDAAPSTTTNPGFNCETICSANEMAQDDIFQWLTALADQLPSGTGVVCVDSTPTSGTPTPDAPECDDLGTYVVKIWWDNNQDGAVDEMFYTSFEP